MAKPKKTYLYIDGENFLFSVAGVLKTEKIINHKSEITKYDLNNLCRAALSEFKISKRRFYAGKVHLHKEAPELKAKSESIIQSQRRLKRSLESQGVEFVLAGHVRLQEIVRDKKGKLLDVTFKEKGTDVRIAVDMLSDTCDHIVDTVLMLSSDSDMQPVVSEIKRRGVQVIYIGFESQPNAGLSVKCDRTILLRKTEIVRAWNSAD